MVIFSSGRDQTSKEISDLGQINHDAVYDNTMLQQEIEEKEIERKDNYKEYWRLYEGKHWDYSELDVDKPTPINNKCYALINKSVSFLVGKPPTVMYPLEEVESLLSSYVKILLDNSGGFPFFSYESAQMGSVTGDCFIKPVYDKEIRGVRLQVCDSEDVDVKYPFKNYQNSIPEVARISYRFLEEGKIKRFVEKWTKIAREVQIDDEIQPEHSGANLLGEIPLIHIKNLLLGKSTYGMSDILQIEPLNKLLNFQIRRFMDDVDYHGDPVTLLYGARISSIEKGEGKMWGNLPFKSKVENLLLETDFPAQQRFIDYLDEAIHSTGSIPKETISGNKAISNTSGIALHMNNMPIIELTDRKRVTYGPGFSKAIMMGLRLMYIIDRSALLVKDMQPKDKLKFMMQLGDYEPIGLVQVSEKIQSIYSKHKDPSFKLKKWQEVEVKFSSYLPKDELIEMQIIREKMNLQLLSRKGALRRLGEDNIERVLEEVDEDLDDMAIREVDAFGQPDDVPPSSQESAGGAQGVLDKQETPAGAAKEAKEKT